jgi:tetratricopeptide (TPR) repeat protein
MAQMHVRQREADFGMMQGQAQQHSSIQPDDRAAPRSIELLRWLRLAGPGRSSARRCLLAVVMVGCVAWLGWNAYGWHHWISANRSLSAGHNKQAANHLTAALRVWPKDAGVHLLAARVSWLNEDFEGAEHHLALCQNDPAAADAAQLERVLVRAAKGDVDAVEGFCYALLEEKHPQTPMVLRALAIGNLPLLRLGETARMLDRWLELEPDHPQAIYLYARVHQQTGNNLDALKFFRRAIELDPSRNDARLALASLHLDLGQAQEALPLLQEACRREPSNTGAKSRLAQGLAMLGRTEEAAVLLDEVLTLRPSLASALLERGKIALRDERLAEAEDYLQQACQSEPNNRAAHYQLLQCLKQGGKTSEARATQERLSQIDDDSKRINDIITVELPQGRLNPELHAELGELLLNAGAVDDGLRWINRALQLAPRLPRAHRALARHYQSLGQARLAQQHLSMIDPADAESQTPQ